jgi:putative ABC transport system permease protein
VYFTSLTTLRDRWQLFVGAVVTICIGVALVQASLLTLIAAATPNIPAGLSATDELLVRDGYSGATALMGMIVAISSFVAVFIVGSTFAFTVAQRRRDFALLRLIGASRRQVRRLLLGEAVVLGALGTTLGVFLGTAVARYEERMLVDLDFVPSGFGVEWRPWIVAVSAGVGVGVAVLGSLGAAHRAGRFRPLVALSEIGAADKVMTLPRWLIGLTALAGAIAMIIVASAVGGEGALALSISVCLVLVIALGALAPLVVPVVAGLIGLMSRIVLPRSRLGELIRSNLRSGVRRSSSTAAPIMMLIGLTVGLSGAMAVMGAGSEAETIQTLDADLVVTAPESIGDKLAAIPGVDVVSEEVPVIVGFQDYLSDSPSLVAAIALAIDPATYALTHRVDDVDGDLQALKGDKVALSRGLAAELQVGLGDTAMLRIDGVERGLQLAATLPASLAGPEILLPLNLAPTSESEHRYIVQIASPDVTDLVIAAAAAYPTAEVSTMDEWIGGYIDAQERMSRNIIVAIVGLAALYTAIAMANAVVIAAADRREEFAIARLTGLSRAQVVRVALWESLIVVVVGGLLGGLAAGGTVLGVSAAVSDIVGSRVIVVPWSLFATVTVGAALIVGVTTVLTALAATRDKPIAVAAARQ